MKNFIVLIAFVFMFLFSGVAHADRIFLKDGSYIDCLVDSQGGGKVTFRDLRGRRFVLSEQVLSIEMRTLDPQTIRDIEAASAGTVSSDLDNKQTQATPPAPSTPPSSSYTLGHIQAVVNEKSVSAGTIGSAGLRLDVELPESPVGLLLGGTIIASSPSIDYLCGFGVCTLTVSKYTEFYVGPIFYVPSTSVFQPFVAGGLSFITVALKASGGGYSLESSDFTTNGYFVEAGTLINLSSVLALGLDARYLFGFNEFVYQGSTVPLQMMDYLQLGVFLSAAF